MKKVAIIGAGIAGLTLGKKMHNATQLDIYEKSRGVGGRLATRYIGEFEFDHGTQFFTAKHDKFKKFIQPLVAAKIIEPWNARFAELYGSRVANTRTWGIAKEHYVGVSRMNMIGKFFASGLPIHNQVEISEVKFNKSRNKWDLRCSQDKEYTEYDWLIFTAPAEQTFKLLPEYISFKQYIAATKMSGCYTIMLGLNHLPDINFDAAVIKESSLSWIARNSSKPGRKTNHCLLAQARNSWADKQIARNVAIEEVEETLHKELKKIIRSDLSIACKGIHRWRYANIAKQAISNKFYLDTEHKIAACGDWCIQGRVESAFHSADALADRLSEII